MSVVGKRVIWVGPVDGANDKPLNVEGVALSAAILPGTILRQEATGLNTSSTPFDVPQLLIVADKDQQRTASVDDAWTIAENMVAIQPRSGEFMNVLVAPTQDIALRGEPLFRTTAGLLTKRNTEVASTTIVNAGTGYVGTEVVTMSGGTGTDATITISTVDGGGEILTFVQTTQGDYSVFPTNPVASTSDMSGMDATFNLTPEFVDAEPGEAVAYSDEIIDTTGGPATGTLVRVRIA